jgi:hypothetical protein
MLMRGTIWGWLTAAIGLAVLVLLVFYGTEYGTWVDEAGFLRPAPPTFDLPFAIGGLGVVLFIGGSVVGMTGGYSPSKASPVVQLPLKTGHVSGPATAVRNKATRPRD